MGIGAVVSIGSGLLSMSASRKQSKAASSAMTAAEAAYDTGRTSMVSSIGSASAGVGAAGAGVGAAAAGVDYAKVTADAMNKLGSEYGAFAQDLWSTWEDDWGDLRGNLMDFYENLDPDKYAVGMKAEIGQELDKQFQQFDQTAAQSGIYTSGMKLQAQKEMQFAKAQEFAQADIEAPEKVAAMQTDFYGAFGDKERTQALQMKDSAYNFQGTMQAQGGQLVTGAYGNLTGAYGNLASAHGAEASAHANMGAYDANMGDKYASSAASYGKAAGTSFGSGLSMLGSGLTSMFSDVRLKKNLRQAGTMHGYDIYDWEWEESALPMVCDQPTRGVLAQDIALTNPDAIGMSQGYLTVDYGKL